MSNKMQESYIEGGPSSDGLPTAPTDPLDILAARPTFHNVLGHSRPLSPPLTAEQQFLSMQSIQAIFELEEEPPGDDDQLGEGDDEEPEVDLEDQRRRTGRLKGVLETLTQFYWCESDYLDVAAEKFADGSRDPKWRIPIGDSGVLNFFLDLLSVCSPRHTLKIHTLRLIGNACADTDENRARVVAPIFLPTIIAQLKDTSLLPFAIPVLYNICIDYAPAQEQASRSFLTKELTQLISSPRFIDSRAFLEYICKLLDLMITQTDEPGFAPENTAVVLLSLAADREVPSLMDDFIALVNTSVAYLHHEKFQKALIQQGALDTTLTVLLDSYARFDSPPSIGSGSPDLDDAKALSQMRSNFNQVLSDVSALPEFKEAVPVVSPFSSSLRRWLSSPQLQLQVCACIMLGNLARSDAACEQFVHTSQVHKPLIAILKEASDSQLLHAALGFLKNLALPAGNKEALGEAGIFDTLPRLWLLDTLQQIQFSSISLARQLCNGTFENVTRICQRLSEDQDSPAYSRTNLSLLIALFERTDVEPIKMEISRLVTAVCRAYNVHKGRTPEEMAQVRKNFFEAHPDIGRPLGFMVSQTKWPAVRSEGWFVFALMARYEEGAECICDLMQDVTVFQPLVEIVIGKSIVDYKPPLTAASSPPPHLSLSPTSSTSAGLSPARTSEDNKRSPESVNPNAQPADMARVDRENALVLVSEILKNRGEQISIIRRTLFEELLSSGGGIVMGYKDKDAASHNAGR